ncbi:hypothetical protein STRIP9103_09139, partial [Streptomyces ipomoeae 91-03]
SSMNTVRSCGYARSSGRYDAPAFNTPRIATTISTPRGTATATTPSGPTPRPRSQPASCPARASNSRYDSGPSSSSGLTTATASGTAATRARHNSTQLPASTPHPVSFHPSSRSRSPPSSRSTAPTRTPGSAITCSNTRKNRS